MERSLAAPNTNHERPMIDALAPGLQYYVDKLNAGEAFTFIRLGDGEWSTIMQDRRITSSRSQVIDDASLRRGMIKVIANAPNDPRYILSMRPKSQRAGIETWLQNNTPPHVQWHDCRVLYKASKFGGLYPFIRALRDLNVPIVLVGPDRLKAMRGKVFDIGRHVVIPNKNCWAQRDRILSEVARNYDAPACYLLTAGPAAKVLAWKMFRDVGQHSWIIDTGSLWDVYVGKASRTYHKGMLKKPDIIEANLNGVTT